jgi:hypothetical protein
VQEGASFDKGGHESGFLFCPHSTVDLGSFVPTFAHFVTGYGTEIKEVQNSGSGPFVF